MIEQERGLLSRLSYALARADLGIGAPGEVERARAALVEFYRALGMHP
jgi:hypothetical protein